MRNAILLSVFFICTLYISCTGKKQYQGDSMANYPDLTLIMKEYLAKYEQGNNTFLKVQTEKQRRDSSFLTAAQMNWPEIHSLFEQANLYRKELDRQYSITVISDTASPTLNLLYTSLNPQNLIVKLSITAENTDNKILSIYWETRDDGLLSSEEKKVLYVVGQTLQIQELSKKPFSGARKKVIQYRFLSGQG